MKPVMPTVHTTVTVHEHPVKAKVRPLLLRLYVADVARFQETVLGGSISCLVALMVLDFGRVIT